MTVEIVAAVAALPSSGGVVRFYSYDRAEHEDNERALRRAAYARRFVLVEWLDGGHGRWRVRLVPQTAAPVRVVHGMRHAGKVRRRRQRRRADRLIAAYRYRDRLAEKIGWFDACRDETFRRLLGEYTKRRKR